MSVLFNATSHNLAALISLLRINDRFIDIEVKKNLPAIIAKILRDKFKYGV